MLKIKMLPADQLQPWRRNPRRNDDAVDAVAGSIKAFGFNVPILCDHDYRIIAGHTRWKAAQKLGLQSVPVILLDLSDAQRDAFAVADNRTGEIAAWDFPRLEEILEDLRSQSVDLSSLGFADAQLQALLEKEQDFDWGAFDRQESQQANGDDVRLSMLVPRDRRDCIEDAIRKIACQQDIAHADSAVVAGAVFAHLLGV